MLSRVNVVALLAVALLVPQWSWAEYGTAPTAALQPPVAVAKPSGSSVQRGGEASLSDIRKDLERQKQEAQQRIDTALKTEPVVQAALDETRKWTDKGNKFRNQESMLGILSSRALEATQTAFDTAQQAISQFQASANKFIDRSDVPSACQVPKSEISTLSQFKNSELFNYWKTNALQIMGRGPDFEQEKLDKFMNLLKSQKQAALAKQLPELQGSEAFQASITDPNQSQITPRDEANRKLIEELRPNSFAFMNNAEASLMEAIQKFVTEGRELDGKNKEVITQMQTLMSNFSASMTQAVSAQCQAAININNGIKKKCEKIVNGIVQGEGQQGNPEGSLYAQIRKNTERKFQLDPKGKEKIDGVESFLRQQQSSMQCRAPSTKIEEVCGRMQSQAQALGSVQLNSVQDLATAFQDMPAKLEALATAEAELGGLGGNEGAFTVAEKDCKAAHSNKKNFEIYAQQVKQEGDERDRFAQQFFQQQQQQGGLPQPNGLASTGAFPQSPTTHGGQPTSAPF